MEVLSDHVIISIDTSQGWCRTGILTHLEGYAFYASYVDLYYMTSFYREPSMENILLREWCRTGSRHLEGYAFSADQTLFYMEPSMYTYDYFGYAVQTHYTTGS